MRRVSSLVSRRVNKTTAWHISALLQLNRIPPCLVGMEACATSHLWAHELEKLGHEVHMMPPRYVKPYLKRNKNDAANSEAICEAVQRPTMRFVSIKTPVQISELMLHRTRQLFVQQRTTLINAIRAHMAARDAS